MFFISIASDYIGKIYLILCKLPPFKVREVINKQSIKTTKMIQEKGTNPFDNEEKDL